MINPYVPQMMSLFEGHKEAYGKFNYANAVREDGKVKGSGITVREPMTIELWTKHLEGKEQLGVIPINEDNMVKFGAIDIDDYTTNPHTKEEINRKIVSNKLPLVQFRSKSGGIHLFIFLSDFTSAALVQRKLKEFASFLGFGNSEIFPKQTQILKARGDVGQWINMPYFDFTITDRYAISSEDNSKLSIVDFIPYAEGKRITGEFLSKFKVGETEELPGGPPCLQHLVVQGFPEGMRNDGLFNLGIYAQKVDPDGWRTLLEKLNEKHMKPPLLAKEILIVMKSLEKKEYNYTCKKAPICNFCNSTLCRTRKHGVGERSGLPAMGSLTKLESDPPLWFIDIEGGGRLELTTEELQNPLFFQRRCMTTLNVMPPVLKREMWNIIVSELLTNLTTIPVPTESTPYGQFLLLVEEFCTNRAGEDEPECLLRGLVWNNNGNHHFRLADLLLFLERKKFEVFNQSKIISILRDFKSTHEKVSVNKKAIYVYTVPFFVKELEKFVPPKQDGNIPF